MEPFVTSSTSENQDLLLNLSAVSASEECNLLTSPDGITGQH